MTDVPFAAVSAGLLLHRIRRLVALTRIAGAHY
jgi:hypothetical protein